MKIRLKLTLQFLLIISVINLVAFMSIYLLSADYRQEEFYDRLHSKATNTAKLLIDVHEIDHDLMRIIDMNMISLPEEKVIIYNFADEVMYNTGVGSAAYPIEFINRIRLEKVLRFREGRDECLGILYEGEFDRFVVISSAYDQYGIRKVNNLKWILIFVFFGSSLITLAAGWFFAGQAVKPIKKVIGEVGQINDKNLDRRIDEGNGKDEIALLANTFNGMLNQLEQAFIAQESFVSHASHELRTPLTSIRGQVEVALMSDRKKNEYVDVLQSILDDVKRLTELSNGLLSLARTKMESIRQTFSMVRIDEILFHSREILLNKWPEYGIQIVFRDIPDDEAMLYVFGEKQLLQSALMNIIENACKYSPDRFALVEIGGEGGQVIIKIQDNGPGIDIDEISRVFLPFYRGRNSSDVSGFGLGLSLTRKILEIHGGNIQILPTNGTGTIVMVILPNRPIFN